MRRCCAPWCCKRGSQQCFLPCKTLWATWAHSKAAACGPWHRNGRKYRLGLQAVQLVFVGAGAGAAGAVFPAFPAVAPVAPVVPRADVASAVSVAGGVGGSAALAVAVHAAVAVAASVVALASGVAGADCFAVAAGAVGAAGAVLAAVPKVRVRYPVPLTTGRSGFGLSCRSQLTCPRRCCECQR